MSRFKYPLVFVVSGVLTALVLALVVNIFERKAEGRERMTGIQQIGEFETDPAVWGVNFPNQWDRWKRTTEDTAVTKYGGSKPIDKIAENPRIKILYAGYPFSVEYNEERGHGWSVVDVQKIKRLGDKKPGTCLSCKSSDTVKMWNEMGAEKFFNTPMKDLVAHADNPISCLNCHDPKTMELTPRNPAFLAVMERRGVDLGKATRQQKRTYVCGQCHVEYYFEKKDNPILHFPWDKGLNLDDIEKFYDEKGFYDWIHPDTGAKLIKIQHPEFEFWSTGIHARSDVSCADCHMPYQRIGSRKYSDHWVRSPMLNVAAACQPCHRWPEQELSERVLAIQDRTKSLLNRIEIALVDAIAAIKACRESGIPDEKLAEAQKLHRRAQIRWDFVFSENSMGFHSPQESARWLAEGIDYARQAESLAKQLIVR